MLLLYLVFIPLISIAQFALSYKSEIFSDDSPLLPYINTVLFAEENKMQAWIATYPMIGVMNIIYYFWFIH